MSSSWQTYFAWVQWDFSGSSTSKMRQTSNDWDPSSAMKSKGRHRIMRHDLCPSSLWIVSEIKFLFPLNYSAFLGQLWFHWFQGYLAMGIKRYLKSPSAQSTSPVCLSYFFKQISRIQYIFIYSPLTASSLANPYLCHSSVKMQLRVWTFELSKVIWFSKILNLKKQINKPLSDFFPWFSYRSVLNEIVSTFSK